MILETFTISMEHLLCYGGLLTRIMCLLLCLGSLLPYLVSLLPYLGSLLPCIGGILLCLLNLLVCPDKCYYVQSMSREHNNALGAC
jgi:hypothetical protein